MPIGYIAAMLIGIGVGLVWGLRIYLMFLMFDELEYFRWERHLVLHIINYFTWGLLLPLVYRAVSQFFRSQYNNSRTWLILIVAGFLLSIIHESLSNLLFFPILIVFDKMEAGYDITDHIFRFLPSALISRLVEFAILFAIIAALDYRKQFLSKQVELAQLESRFSSAQLNALRLQLHPHFLFNTLNTISSLMEFDKKKAQKIVSQLGSMLRNVLDQNKQSRIPLREELDFIKNYLNIEQVRFQDRLSIHYQIDEETLDALVPSLILQPLVENAVKHGFAKNAEPGQIEVSTRKMNDNRLELRVSDDGMGSSKSETELLTSGIGLKNIHERLTLLYKKEFKLTIDAGNRRGFDVSITMPLEKS